VKALSRRLWLYGIAAPVAVAASAGALWRPSADADTLASAARFQLQFGLLEEAERGAAAALEQDPDHLEALLVAGACAGFRGRREEARAFYERSLPSIGDPDLAAEVRVALALAHLDAGRIQEAAAALEGARPASGVVLAKVDYAGAVLAHRRGDRQGALEASARALGGADLPLRAGIAGLLAAMREEERALEALRPGIEGGDPPSLYAAARLKFAGGDAEEGATLLRRADSGARAWIRNRMRQDATFWKPYRASGELPADVTGYFPERSTEEENASGGRND
jgi:tetratricopeptide (TPR) repeat protein